MLSIIDPQNNEVFFDSKSIGLAIVNSELSSNVHDMLKITLKNPIAIFEQPDKIRTYISITESLDVHIVNVIFRNSIWYAESLNIETGKEEFIELNNKSKAIYKRLA